MQSTQEIVLLYVRCTYVGSMNEKFSHNARNE